MNIKKAIVSCLLAAGLLPVAAQEQEQKTEYVFNPHWYIQGQVGAQYTLGELSFSDHISPNAQIGIGYNINSVFGLRLAVNAWQSTAGWEKPDNTYNKYDWKWNYVSPNLDLTFNLSNLICGFNPNRILNVSVYAGAGANIAWGNEEANEIKAKLDKEVYKDFGANENLDYLWEGTNARFNAQAGIMADFRVSDRISLGLEVQANTLSDRYNSKRAGNADWYFNALAGVKINLGKTYTTRVIEPVKPVERIVEKVVEKVVEKRVPVEVEQPKMIRRDIFFEINSNVISDTEIQKVTEIADYLKQNPNAKVTITGYADKDTGNKKINSELGNKRSKAVTDALVNIYGIAPNRIITDSKGDTVQPHSEQVKNRVSICIAK